MIEIKTLEIAGMASVLQALRLPTIQPIIYEVDNEVSRLFGINKSVVRRLLSSGRKYTGCITKLKNSTFEYVRD